MFFLIARQARSHDPASRTRAAQKLGSGGRASSPGGAVSRPVALLLELAGDADTGVRAAAFESLGRVADAVAVPRMVSALEDVDKLAEPGAASVREAAASALRAIGPAAIPALVTLSKHRNARLREIAVAALSGIGGPDAEAALAGALQDGRSSVRQAAVRGLAASAAQGTIGALSAALGHKDPATRKTAIEAMNDIRAADAVAALRRLTRDPDRSVREAAVRALARQASPEAVDALLAVFEGPDRDLRQVSAAALKNLEWQPATSSQRALRAIVNGDYAAAATEGHAAVEPLSALLADKAPSVRAIAAEALGRTGDGGAVRPLLVALQDSDVGVRQAAGNALVRIGTAAIEPLACAVHESVRSIAPTIVAAVGPAAANPLLDVIERGEPYHDAGAEQGDGPREAIRVSEDEEAEQAQSAAHLLGRLMHQAGSEFDRPTVARIARLRDVVRVREVVPTNRRELPQTVIDTVVDCSELRARAATLNAR